MKGFILPIETFDVTDENGARVTGTAEAYRDQNGEFYDPNSEYYQNPRFSNRNIRFLNDKDLCRINRSVLSQAVQEAFRRALTKLGIPDPSKSAVESDVNNSITEALRECVPMAEAVPPAALREPPTSMADLIIDHIRRRQQPNAGRPQSPLFDTGAASLPFAPAVALAPSGYGALAGDSSQGKPPIRRLMRVQPS